MNRFLGAACAVVLLAACSQGDQTVDSGQQPSEPIGSVVGVVTSLRTGAPLPGVTVSVPGPGGRVISATTDSSGAYSLSGLVAGPTYTVRFASTGYVSRFGDATIPNSAGDFPSNGLAQLDMALAQSNATLSGHVYARDGEPASGVVLVADLRARGFDLVATATTDANGAYALTGLPGAPTGLTVSVVVQPWDANGDEVADYHAVSVAGATYPGTTALLDVDLRLAAPELLLLTSNVESGTIAADAAIQLEFNQALDASLTAVSLYDSSAGRTVAVVASSDPTGKILTVVPAPSPGTSLAPNHAYTLDVDGVAAANGSTVSASRSFTAQVPTNVLPAVTGLAVRPAQADFDTSTFTLSWDASANATGYEVWVRDTRGNPDYLLVQTVGTSAAPSATVTLPYTFDWYSGDAIQTPFAFGVGVDFAVVAENAAGALLPSSITPVHRTDTVLPVVERAVQAGDANNSAGATARTVTLTLTFGEYMDTSVLPTITLPGGATAGPFAWNAKRTTGTFSITIAASTDGRGDYTVSEAKDTSGNLMTPRAGTLVGQTELVTDGGFETGTLSGWTTYYSGTATVPVATSSVAATGLYSAQLGNATASAQYGYSRLYRNVTLPTGYSSIVLSIAYRPYTGSSYDSSSCAIKDSAGSYLYRSVFSSSQTSSSFTTATADLTVYAGMTVRLVCETYQYGLSFSGMYLDDVSIIATP
jgi:hypothetical protein